MRSVRCMTGGIILAGCLAWQGALLAAPEVVHVRLSEPVADWEMDQATGRTFALLPGARAVVEYDGEGKEVRRFDVGPAATELELVKGNRLVVLCAVPPMIYQFDLDKNEPMREIKLEGVEPRAIFASPRDDSSLYYLSLRSPDQRAQQLMRVGLDQEEPAATTIHADMLRDMTAVAMSPDGSWFVPYRRRTVPSVTHLCFLGETTGKIELRGLNLRQSGEVVASPSSQGWLLGGRLYSLDGTREIRDYQGSRVAVHPERDVVAVWDGTRVVLRRYSDATPIETLPDMPRENIQPDFVQPAPSSSTWPAMRFDMKSEKLFVGHAQDGFWVTPETKLGELPLHRWIDVPVRVAATIGKPLELVPKVKSPLELPADDQLTIQLKENPYRVEYRDGKVDWTPPRSMAGEVRLGFELWSVAENRVIDTAETVVEVHFPTIELDFSGEEMVASPDGRHLLVIGPVASRAHGRAKASGPFAIVVVDRQKSQVVGQRTIDGRVQCYAIDNEAIYIVTSTSSAVTRYNFALEDEGFYLPTEFPIQLVRLPGQQMAVVPNGFHNGRSWWIIDVKTMKLVEEVAPVEGQPLRSRPALVDDRHLLIDGGVVDSQTGRMVLLTDMLPLPALTPGRFPPSFTQRPGENLIGRRWGMKPGPKDLKSASGETLFTWQDDLRISTLLEAGPGVAIVHRTVGTGEVRGAELVIRNLLDGKVEYTCPIYLSSQGADIPPGGQTSGGSRRMVEVGDELVVLLNERLVSIPLPMEKLRTLPRPPRFAWEQPMTVEIQPYGVSRVTAKALDVEEGTRFAQLLPTTGVVIHPVTGELTIASGELWETFVSTPDRPGGQRPLPISRTDITVFDVKENEALYRRLTGNELPEDKFAVWIPLYLQLTSPRGHVDRLPWSLILLAPRKDVEAELARRQEQERLQEEIYRRSRRSGPGDEEARARLRQLEQRVIRMEELLERLLRELEQEKPKE